MPRRTQWYRTSVNQYPNTVELFNIAGVGDVVLFANIPSTDHLLRVMVHVDLTTQIVANPGESLGVGFWGNAAQILFGLWTDAYGPESSPPDPGASAADPGWLAQGQLEWYDLVNTYDDLNHLIAVTFKWRLCPTFKWDIERSVAPTIQTGQYSVYAVWNNRSIGGYSLWDNSNSVYVAGTTGTLFAQGIVNVPGP